MKFPIMLLSYGAFGADQKKIYICERDGKLYLPIFHDTLVAAQFQSAHQKIIEGFGDTRPLVIQVCQKPQYMYDMLVAIMSINPEITSIIFDPSPPNGISEGAIKAGAKALDRIVSIEDVVQDLDNSI